MTKVNIEELDRAFVFLAKRAYALEQDTEENLSFVIDVMDAAMTTIERVVLAKAKAKSSLSTDLLMSAVDKDFKEKGFFQGNSSFISKREVSKDEFFRWLESLKERSLALAEKAKIDPMYLADAIHLAFDDVYEETISFLEMEEEDKERIGFKEV